jgi:hypothetical protein
MTRQNEYARSILPPKPGATAGTPSGGGGSLAAASHDGGGGGADGGSGGAAALGRRRSSEPVAVPGGGSGGGGSGAAAAGGSGVAARRPLFMRRQAALSAATPGSVRGMGGDDGSVAGGRLEAGGGPAIQLPGSEWDPGAPSAGAMSGLSYGLWSPSTVRTQTVACFLCFYSSYFLGLNLPSSNPLRLTCAKKPPKTTRADRRPVRPRVPHRLCRLCHLIPRPQPGPLNRQPFDLLPQPPGVLPDRRRRLPPARRAGGRGRRRRGGRGRGGAVRADGEEKGRGRAAGDAEDRWAADWGALLLFRGRFAFLVGFTV